MQLSTSLVLKSTFLPQYQMTSKMGQDLPWQYQFVLQPHTYPWCALCPECDSSVAAGEIQ